MAERRMFSKNLMFSSSFVGLSKTAQVLYLFLCLQADDDGLCDNARGVCRMCGIGKKYLQELVDGGWLMEFGSEIVAVTHWHIHNQIRKDRYKPSIHQEVAQQLLKCSDGRYVVAADGNQMATNWQPSIDKIRKEKDR